MKILVVEDSEELRLYWREALELAGHDVTEAGSYTDACTKMQQTVFSVILSDYLLEDGSGRDVADFAGVFSPLSEVVITTGARLFHNGEIFEECQNVSYLLRKPVRMGDLLAVLGYCDRRHASSVVRQRSEEHVRMLKC